MVKISVVVCAKNEGERIRAALDSIRVAAPDEIVVVDGNSSDNTVDIAREYTDHVVVSHAGSLTMDRQVGIDAAKNDLIAMIDADHRLKPGDIEALYQDLEHFGFDIVQAPVDIEEKGFWCAAENQAFSVFHHQPGPRSMIGTAPAIYRRRVFEKVRFDGTITRNKDDADFIYRLSLHPEFTYGIGRIHIAQSHFCDFKSYVQKFAWYGKGDSEFCRKHKNRAPSMIFHLFFRYPVMRSVKAIATGKFKAVPYFILCGLTRGLSMLRHLLIAAVRPS